MIQLVLQNKTKPEYVKYFEDIFCAAIAGADSFRMPRVGEVKIIDCLIQGQPDTEITVLSADCKTLEKVLVVGETFELMLSFDIIDKKTTWKEGERIDYYVLDFKTEAAEKTGRYSGKLSDYYKD